MAVLLLVLGLCSVMVALRVDKDDAPPLEALTALVQSAFSSCHCMHLVTDNSSWAVQAVLPVVQKPPCSVTLTPGAKDHTKYLCSDYLFVVHNGEIARNLLLARRPYSIDRVMIFVQSSAEALHNDGRLFGDAEALLVTTPSLDVYRLDPAVVKWRKFHLLHDATKLFLGISWLHYSNFQNRSLIVNTFTLLPFSSIENDTRDGIEMAMFTEASRLLNFTWTILEPPQSNRYGEWLENETWYGGIAGLLIDGSSEVAFCTLYLVRNKILYLDMTWPWNQVCITFMVPRPERIQNRWTAPLSPFEVSLWLGLFAGACLVAVALWLVSLSDSGSPLSVDLSALWVMGLLLLGSFPPLGPARAAVRKLLLCWSFFGLLMVTAYSSKLVSHLTVQRYEKPLDSIRDLVEADMYWGMDYEVPKGDIFDHKDPWAFDLVNRFKAEVHHTDRDVRLRKKNYAILGTRVNGKNFIEGIDVDSKKLYRLRGMRDCLNKFFIAFALPKLSPLTQPFSLVLSRYVESGLTLYWHRDVVTRLSDPALASLSLESPLQDTQELQAFSLANLGGMFILCIIGHSVAICTFILERPWRTCTKKVSPSNKLKALDHRLQTDIGRLRVHTPSDTTILSRRRTAWTQGLRS